MNNKHYDNLSYTKAIDLRRSIPKELFKIKGYKFFLKFSLAILIVLISITSFIFYDYLLINVFAIITLGIMYAHLVELQHECLHHHAFKKQNLNDIFGFLCGIFMFSFYSHYRYDHLKHHAKLNYEHFDYRHRNLNSLRNLIIASINLSRYKLLYQRLICSFFGGSIDDVKNEKIERKIKQEYRLMTYIFLLTMIFFLFLGRIDLLFFCWILPTILISESVHFLIETPEHYGLDTQNNSDVLENTWTIYTGSNFLKWIANGNNLHTAHHFHPVVPMQNVKKLQSHIDTHCQSTEKGYISFYRNVIEGNITYKEDSSSMKH